MTLTENIEKTDSNNAIITLTNGEQLKANKNENGWAAYGVDENGNNWETDDFKTLEELSDDIETFING